MGWWHKNNLRLIQNNIMETDAAMDVDKLIEKLKYFNANVLMLNTGGIEAFYPTALEYHYRSPYLQGDLIGEVLEKCHREGIRFIARFDFSKAHSSIYAKHPGWFYKPAAGNCVNYNGMVHTCVNGGYQREYALKIIDEVIHRYPVDGIFFNMFGYQTRDYSGNYHGICRCDSCRVRFQQMYGKELPEKEDGKDAAYRDYVEFKEITTRELLDAVHDLVKGANPEIAICTYTDYRVDMVRNESNSAVDRPYPFWLYSASENVKSVEDTWSDKTISNCVINAVDIPYRFMGVSKYLTRIRLYESMASGSGLDFCIIGTFEGYPDQDNFGVVKEVFDFHKTHEKYYGNFTSMADIALIKNGYSPVAHDDREYLGIFKMLKEAHVLFDVICRQNIHDRLRDLERYRLVILPDYRLLCDEALVSAIREKGIHILVTNPPAQLGEEAARRVDEILGGKYEGTTGETRSAYLETTDKEIFKSFPHRDWVFIDGRFSFHGKDEGSRNLLPYVTPARYGPPERCGGHTISGYCGASIKYTGNAAAVALPWQVGYLYYQYGYEDHKHILLDLTDHILGDCRRLTTDAPKNVEMFLDRYDGKNYILQLLNLTGCNGTTFYEPNPVFGIQCSIRGITGPVSVQGLAGGNDNIAYRQEGQELLLKIRRLDAYEAVIINLEE